MLFELDQYFGIEETEVKYFVGVVLIVLPPGEIPFLQETVYLIVGFNFLYALVPVLSLPVLDLVVFGAVKFLSALAAAESSLLVAHLASSEV